MDEGARSKTATTSTSTTHDPRETSVIQTCSNKSHGCQVWLGSGEFAGLVEALNSSSGSSGHCPAEGIMWGWTWNLVSILVSRKESIDRLHLLFVLLSQLKFYKTFELLQSVLFWHLLSQTSTKCVFSRSKCAAMSLPASLPLCNKVNRGQITCVCLQQHVARVGNTEFSAVKTVGGVYLAFMMPCNPSSKTSPL